MNEDLDHPENANHELGENEKRHGQPADQRGITVNVEQAAIDAVNADENSQKPQRDNYDKANLIILSFTFLAALSAAGFTFWIAYKTHHIANDSTKTYDATNRAYIAITGVKFDGWPEVGKNQRIKILFKNVGKEAASDFSLSVIVSNQFDFEPDSKGMPYVPPDKVQWPYVDHCSVNNAPGAKVIGQRPVYPEIENEVIWYAFNPGGSTPGAVFVPQRLLDGKTTFLVAGCAAYRSLDKPRHSPFCFYYQPARGGDVREGTFEWCPVGAGNAG